MKMVFDAGNSHYQFLAQSLDNEPTTWYTEYYQISKDNRATQDSPSQNPQYAVLSGVLKCLRMLMKNHPEIESLIFNVKKDSAQINLFDKIVKRKMFPGWTLADQKDGWFKISKTK